MIANSVILPTEQPVDIHDIKRALLTYDKIYIPSPDDRELIPPNTYKNAVFNSIGFPAMPFGGSFGPVKPLGKTDSYDEKFEITIKQCKNAISQGVIEILGAPTYVNEMTIGVTPIPNDTPNPPFTYFNFRQLSENEDFVKLMSEGLKGIDFTKVKDISKLIPSGQEDEEQSVNDKKRSPKVILELPDRDDESSKVLSKMCHTRIGSLVKYLGYCYIKQLHPFTTDLGYANVLSKLEYNFIGTVESIESDELQLKRQKRLSALHNLIIREYIDPKSIDSMDVNQIIKKRTKAWGRTQENRSKLFSELNEIALDCESDSKFENACNKKFKDFLKIASDYQYEIHKLNLILLFDANLFFFLKGPEFQLLEKILKAPSYETLLIVGSLGFRYAREHLRAILDIIKKAEDKRQATGYAIYSNYRYLMT